MIINNKIRMNATRKKGGNKREYDNEEAGRREARIRPVFLKVFSRQGWRHFASLTNRDQNVLTLPLTLQHPCNVRRYVSSATDPDLDWPHARATRGMRSLFRP